MKRTNIMLAALCGALVVASPASAGVIKFTLKVFLVYGLYELVDGASEERLSEQFTKRKNLASDLVRTYGKGMHSLGKRLRRAYEDGMTPSRRNYLIKMWDGVGNAGMGVFNDVKKEWGKRRRQPKKEGGDKKAEANFSEKSEK